MSAWRACDNGIFIWQAPAPAPRRRSAAPTTQIGEIQGRMFTSSITHSIARLIVELIREHLQRLECRIIYRLFNLKCVEANKWKWLSSKKHSTWYLPLVTLVGLLGSGDGGGGVCARNATGARHYTPNINTQQVQWTTGLNYRVSSAADYLQDYSNWENETKRDEKKRDFTVTNDHLSWEDQHFQKRPRLQILGDYHQETSCTL